MPGVGARGVNLSPARRCWPRATCLFAELQLFRKDADADLAACLQQELAGATARYQALKAAAGALDFGDLLAKARDLIKANEEVRRHLQTKFARIFVDEFQDTDPIQAEILLLLAADDPQASDPDDVRPSPGKLFIVGDPKQAIYRFRGTDVGTYWRVSQQTRIARRPGPATDTSYRSVPSIQHFVNAAFGREMIADERTLQAGYVPLAEFTRGRRPSQPSVVALPVPKPYGRRGFGALKASAHGDRGIAAGRRRRVHRWLTDEDRGWTVSRAASRRHRRARAAFSRATSPSCSADSSVSARTSRAATWTRSKRAAFRICWSVERRFTAARRSKRCGRRSRPSSGPTTSCRCLRRSKGPLFAIDDEHLFEFRHRFGVFHPFRVPAELGGNSGQELALTGEPTAHLVPIADALRLLQQLHRGRNYRPVADTIGRLLADTRAHVGFILRPAGEQALANVLHVAELARQYEAGGGISFRGFIDELKDAAQSTEVAEAPILEEGSDGVR